jgi:uncharacterized membrane protein
MQTAPCPWLTPALFACRKCTATRKSSRSIPISAFIAATEIRSYRYSLREDSPTYEVLFRTTNLAALRFARDNRDMNYACEAAMGAVSGLRSFTGPAIISEAANRKLLNLDKSPLSFLASGNAAKTSIALAVGELITDKLPFTPDRTKIPSLMARFVAGAVAGAAIAGKRKRNDQIAAAVVGGAAAIAAAYAGYQYRKHVKLPGIVAALLEDAVAIGAGAAIVARACA